VLWSDVKTGMLVTYAFNCRTEHFEIVDVGSIRIERSGQCLLLMTISLIGGIEYVVQVRNLAELQSTLAPDKCRRVQGVLICCPFTG